MNQQTVAEASPIRNLRWVYIFIGLLVVHASSMIIMAVIASSDPSFAVEPGYYEQALNWDAAAAQAAHNEQLGWTLGVTVGEEGQGGRSLEVALRDRENRPLEGAAVSIEFFHHARSAERLTASLVPRQAPGGKGIYAAELPLSRSGMWELRISVERGPETFTRRMQIDVPLAGGGDAR